MSEQAVKDAAIRMATDDQFRAAVQSDDPSALAGLQLTEEERAMLRSLASEGPVADLGVMATRLSKSSMLFSGVLSALQGDALHTADPAVTHSDFATSTPAHADQVPDAVPGGADPGGASAFHVGDGSVADKWDSGFGPQGPQSPDGSDGAPSVDVSFSHHSSMLGPDGRNADGGGGKGDDGYPAGTYVGTQGNDPGPGPDADPAGLGRVHNSDGTWSAPGGGDGPGGGAAPYVGTQGNDPGPGPDADPAGLGRVHNSDGTWSAPGGGDGPGGGAAPYVGTQGNDPGPGPDADPAGLGRVHNSDGTWSAPGSSGGGDHSGDAPGTGGKPQGDDGGKPQGTDGGKPQGSSDTGGKPQGGDDGGKPQGSDSGGKPGSGDDGGGKPGSGDDSGGKPDGGGTDAGMGDDNGNDGPTAGAAPGHGGSEIPSGPSIPASVPHVGGGPAGGGDTGQGTGDGGEGSSGAISIDAARASATHVADSSATPTPTNNPAQLAQTAENP